MKFRNLYVLLKDTPELKKGAIMQEDCTDGTQGFHCISKEFHFDETQEEVAYTRKVVMENPTFFRKASFPVLAKTFIKSLKGE